MCIGTKIADFVALLGMLDIVMGELDQIRARSGRNLTLNTMYGKGILKGLSVTWKRFWNTYVDDISWLVRGKKRYNSAEGIAHRSSAKTRGIFTVQYPEERLLLPEELRYLPVPGL